MFAGFFHELKRAGVPVTLNEWMTLHQALEKGLADSSLNAFYHLARAVLVKNETYFDRYDRVYPKNEIALGLRNNIFAGPLQLDVDIEQGVDFNKQQDIFDLATQYICEYRLSHSLALPDAVIGATAIFYEVPLFTYNRKDFKFLPEISLAS